MSEALIPTTGELVNLEDPGECARALVTLRDLGRQIREAESVINDAIIAQSMIQGSKTIHTAAGKVTVKGGDTRTSYDAAGLEHDLRAAGMPEERIREIVRETVSYTVRANEAKRAAAANPVYARAVEANRTEVPSRPYVSIEAT